MASFMMGHWQTLAQGVPNFNDNRMNLFRRKNIASLVSFLMIAAHISTLRGEELNENERQFLARYETVRAALAADNLENAKASAKELGKEGKALVESKTLEIARAAFSKLSVRAISLARGRAGFYVIRCPMLNEMWLQPAGTISNPYAGRSMPECGMILR